jgi:hypothetical protein
MKKLIIHIAIILLASGPGTIASAANLDGHLQYRIVSYNFSSDQTTDSNSTIHFDPLLITNSASDILTDSLYGSSGYGIQDPKQATDIYAVSAYFTASPELSWHGTIGITKNRWDASLDSDYNSSWEANLGIIYKLFNNVRYEVHFGYMDTGDLFKESQAYSDVESIIMISNKLTMSF